MSRPKTQQDWDYQQHKVVRTEYPQYGAVYITLTSVKNPILAGQRCKHRVIDQMKDPSWSPKTLLQRFIVDHPNVKHVVEVIDDFDCYYTARGFQEECIAYARDVEGLTILNMSLVPEK